MTQLPNKTFDQPGEICTPVDLSAHYHSVRQHTVALCSPLSAEDYVPQPTPDVSPPKWHLGHTSWFFENFILIKQLKDYQLFDERLNWFFNSYYESQGPRILRTQRGNMTRPGIETILAYRKTVDEAIDQLFIQHNNQLPQELADLLLLGLHHEQQHQELLVTDLKYILGTNPLFPAYAKSGPDPAQETQAAPAAFDTIDAGLYTIGYQGTGFCWDNELSSHQVYLESFQISNQLVTNGEYLEFMKAGGYKDFALWQMEGIEWARQLEEKAPLYWYEKDGQWWQYSLRGLEKVDPDLPITHLSWYEADAYARWRAARLPTEAEWEVAARKFQPEGPADNHNWLESDNFHPTRATDRQYFGQVWEWTNSAYLPYPRYPRPDGALGEYNGKFMINQMVLRGGSCATPRSHIRVSYRNFFQPDKRWQFTGLRLAKDVL